MTDTFAAPDTATIWQPLDIGATRVRHRVMATGHTQLYGRDHIISDRHIAYYRERARGGAALLILEQQAVHPAGMNYHAGCVAYDERVIPQYRELAEAVHAEDCKQFVQLFAGGSQGRGTIYIDNFHPLWAVSRVPSVIYNETPMVMRQEHIDEMVDGFATSAANVKAAGLDGVELHAAHNQCIGEFLSPGFNKRDDKYGGTVENRCRLLIEIAQEVRRRCGDDFTVGARMSYDEYLGPEGGITPEDTHAQVEVLAATGLLDFFDISGGGYHTMHIAVSPMGGVDDAFLAPGSQKVKEIVGDRATVMVVGRIIDLGRASKVIDAGQADMVAMTRAHMADPELVNKHHEGRGRETVKCVGANVCVSRLVGEVGVTCVFNPAMGRETELGIGTLQRAPTPRKVAVVGGGPAGMRCAATAAQRGHHVTLVEAGNALGGHLELLSRLPSRENWRMGIQNLVTPLEVHGVEIRTSTRATADSLREGGYDVVVCATGSRYTKVGYSPMRPERPGITGTDAANVLDVATAIERALENPLGLGARVLIMDETDRYLPMGLAELLAKAEVEVEIISPHFFVGGELVSSLDYPHVVPRLKAAGVRLTGQQFIEAIAEGTADVYDVWGGERRSVAADTFVISSMREPDEALYDELVAAGFAQVESVGDVVAPRATEAVIYEAEMLGRRV